LEESDASIDALIDGKMPLAAELMAVSAGVGTMAAGGLQYYSDDGSAELPVDFDAEFGRNVGSVTIPSYATWIIWAFRVTLIAPLLLWISSLFSPTTCMLPMPRRFTASL